MGFPSGSVGKESTCDTEVCGSIPGPGRSLGEGTGYPLQHPCLENPMDRGAWWATVQGVAKRHDWSDSAHTHTHTPLAHRSYLVRGNHDNIFQYVLNVTKGKRNDKESENCCSSRYFLRPQRTQESCGPESKGHHLGMPASLGIQCL